MASVLCTTSSFSPEAARPLTDTGLEMVYNPFGRRLSIAELLALVASHRPVGLLAGSEELSRAVLSVAALDLKVVSRVGVGWDNVDHAAAAEFGIRVFRTPGVLDAAVAELTLGLILAALRQLVAHDRDIRRGEWRKRMGGQLAGRTVGIVGLGGIGRRVGELAHAFGARVVFSDLKRIEAPFAEPLPLDALLRAADVVSLHVDGKGRIIGAEELALMRPTAILVNTARGGLIDEAALAEALANGRLGFACLDVFERMPYSGPLAGLDNTLLTPHVGSYAAEARACMEQEAVRNLLLGLTQAGAAQSRS